MSQVQRNKLVDQAVGGEAVGIESSDLIQQEGPTMPHVPTQPACVTDGHLRKAGLSSCWCKGTLRNYRLVYFAGECMVILGVTGHSTRGGLCPVTGVSVREKAS